MALFLGFLPNVPRHDLPRWYQLCNPVDAGGGGGGAGMGARSIASPRPSPSPGWSAGPGAAYFMNEHGVTK
eukprot:1614271-Pyramimonas_sp.AAC.1